MQKFLFNIIVLIALPFFLIFALFDGILAFVKAFVKSLKDWSDLLEL